MKIHVNIIPAICIASLLIVGCENNNQAPFDSAESIVLDEANLKRSEMPAAREAEMDIPAVEQPPVPQEQIDQKLIKTGNIRFQSDHIDEDYNRIKSLIRNVNGYIENENQSKSDYQIAYTMTIRVEAGQFDSLFTNLVSFPEKLDEKSSQVQDVTDQYVDLETRINNLKILEQRYRDILLKATEIKDILNIEQKINEVRTDIERMEGSMNVLNKQIRYSTIHLYFYEILPYSYVSENRPGFWARMASSLDDGFQLFLSFVVGLTALWPFIILIIGGIFFFRYIRMKRKNLKT